MRHIFVDTERIRDLNSGLGQTCLRVGQELVRQQPSGTSLTFLVPPGQSGVFGEASGDSTLGTLHYREATWWQRFYGPGPDGSDRFDIWHNLHQDAAYWPAQRPERTILTINDLNFLERADYSEAKKRRKLAAVQRRIDRAQVLTTISDYSGSVVREHLHVPGNVPLKTVYIGVSALPTPPVDLGSNVPEQLGTLVRPFFLFLGVIHPKKNIHVLLALAQAFPDYTLVLAGRDNHPYAQHLRQQAEQLGIADNVLFTGPVDETTKAWLYMHCEAFLFPSLSEGFGLPVVEAMSFGKPVFLSRLTSLPEVGGKEAFYFDSFEPEAVVETFREGMQTYYEDPLKAQRLTWQAKRFSWAQTGKAYWELYSMQ